LGKLPTLPGDYQSLTYTGVGIVKIQNEIDKPQIFSMLELRCFSKRIHLWTVIPVPHQVGRTLDQGLRRGSSGTNQAEASKGKIYSQIFQEVKSSILNDLGK